MKQVPVALIRKPAKLRPLNEAVVKSLMESFKSAGQISPVVLKRDSIMRDRREDGFLLISGNHRLTAAINLGWETIGAEVYDQDHNAVHLELIEVDENLCRAELSAAEKAAALKKRKILWESLREQKETGGNLVPTSLQDGRIAGPQHQPGFAASTAEVTGMSKRAINEYIRIADTLGDDALNNIQGSELDSKQKLLELAKAPQEDREDMIETITQKQQQPDNLPINQPRTALNQDPNKLMEKVIRLFNRLPYEHQLLVFDSFKTILADDD